MATPGTDSEIGAEIEDQTGREAPAVMAAVVQRQYGTPDVLELDEVPVPTPGADQVLIEVEATSLNALDWHFLTGTPYLVRLSGGIRRPKRTTPGSDVAGTVVAVGAEVTRFAVGDRVFGEIAGGGCGHYAIGKEAGLVAMPAGVSFEAAGATPVAGLTAVQGLRTKADLQPGEQVLINGAAGGVGTFAVQIAKALGAEVTAVCSTRNVEMVRRLGADRVIDYTRDDFTSMPHRFDVMFDNVGNHRASRTIGVLKPEARYVLTTGPKKNPWVDPMRFIAGTALRFLRASQSFHQYVATPDVDDLTFLGELLASGQLKPEIQRVVGLGGVTDGLTEIGTGHVKAKIVVVPGR
jgi:NADPH:quinone reductase-like Zn-dependent oxidoreductase